MNTHASCSLRVNSVKSSIEMLFLSPGGAAEQSRVIDVGDELLAINGRSLQGLMHYDAWNIIKTVSEGPVQLVIKKPRTSV